MTSVNPQNQAWLLLSKREDLRLQPTVCIIACAYSRRKQHSPLNTLRWHAQLARDFTAGRPCHFLKMHNYPRPQFGFSDGYGESANIHLTYLELVRTHQRST